MHVDDYSPPKRSLLTTLREFLYGVFGLEFAQHALEMRASVESLFMMSIVGDMIGIPIMLVGWMVGIFGVFYYYYHFIPGHDRLTNKIKDFGRRYLQELGFFSKTQPSQKNKNNSHSTNPEPGFKIIFLFHLRSPDPQRTEN